MVPPDRLEFVVKDIPFQNTGSAQIKLTRNHNPPPANQPPVGIILGLLASLKDARNTGSFQNLPDMVRLRSARYPGTTINRIDLSAFIHPVRSMIRFQRNGLHNRAGDRRTDRPSPDLVVIATTRNFHQIGPRNLPERIVRKRRIIFAQILWVDCH